MTHRTDRTIGSTCAPVRGAGARPASAGRPAVLSWGVALLVFFLPFLPGASPVVAQTLANGSVLVRVPPVAQLEVESVADGVFEIRVRANHGWQVVLGATAESVGTGDLWVRTAGLDGTSEERRIEPGQSLAVASGARGEAVIRLDYWWEGGSTEESSAVPFTYTLASR